jgi:hypothetical protein
MRCIIKSVSDEGARRRKDERTKMLIPDQQPIAYSLQPFSKHLRQFGRGGDFTFEGGKQFTGFVV